ncbi:MAG: hypothetical protein HY456_02465 [Parcubacteria group bacterium]|nr:hypothetical protein [Parcubacteria group bacterium]
MQARLQSNSNTQFLRGSILIEAVIAISIIVVAFSGLLSLLSSSLGINRTVGDQYIATNIAAEGIEIVKNLIDANILQCQPWNGSLADGDYEADYNQTSLAPYGNRPLLFDSSNGVYSYDSGVTTNFKRRITVNNVSADEIRVNSAVAWIGRGGGSFSLAIEDHFFNWRSDVNLPPACQ